MFDFFRKRFESEAAAVVDETGDPLAAIDAELEGFRSDLRFPLLAVRGEVRARKRQELAALAADGADMSKEIVALDLQERSDAELERRIADAEERKRRAVLDLQEVQSTKTLAAAAARTEQLARKIDERWSCIESKLIDLIVECGDQGLDVQIFHLTRDPRYNTFIRKWHQLAWDLCAVPERVGLVELVGPVTGQLIKILPGCKAGDPRLAKAGLSSRPLAASTLRNA